MTTTRILLVEDEPLWQEGIQNLLMMEADLEVIGVADNFEDGLALYHTEQPDVVLLDWKLPGGKDGLALGETLVQRGHPPERIILVSGSDPAFIPENPYPFVPKPKIADLLVRTLRETVAARVN